MHHKRSLEAEVRAILERAAQEPVAVAEQPEADEPLPDTREPKGSTQSASSSMLTPGSGLS
jgi:hypothetical protein